ncbi:MAG: 2OG-Fe(II) oxygenase [Methylococcales bacterium]|nr:2OG-Fe(II) oxygenase [Methylococcales bacterium]
MLTKITEALKSVESQGGFSAKQVTIATDLNLEIKGVGKLRLPLKPSKVKSLIKVARPAKFGWKDQTLLDPEVRNVWEIPKSNVKIDKRQWNKTFNPVLEKLKKQLGLPIQGKLKAHLHNALIYEKGQFFQPHQDSEKGEGMVATLVVVLPSFYRGGSLNVSLQGQKKNYPSTSTPQDKLTFIAFYADCYHQVRPVTDGYRVVLTYNLMLDDECSEGAVAPGLDGAQNVLSNAVSGYFSQPIEQKTHYGHPRNRKLVYLLDHEYTQKGLSWKTLKNGDRVRTQLLQNLAEELNLELYLGLIDLHEVWYCDDHYDEWRYQRYRRERWDDDDDDSADYERIELIEKEASVIHWLDSSGKPSDLEALDLANTDICWTTETETFEPVESEYQGYMGNWGNTEDRWYHRAAVIAWPRHEHYAVMLEFSPSQVIHDVFALASKKASLPQAAKIVQQLLPYWSGLEDKAAPKAHVKVLKMSLLLNDAKVAQQLCTPLGISAFSRSSVKILLNLAQAYSTQWWVDLMQAWVAPGKHERSIGKIKNLSDILQALVSAAPTGHDAFSNWLVRYQFKVIQSQHAEMPGRYSAPEMAQSAKTVCQEISGVLLLCRLANKQSLHDEVMHYVQQSQHIYPALELAELALDLSPEYKLPLFRQWQFSTLLVAVMDTLTVEVQSGLRKANDWSIWEKGNCSCADCVELMAFLQSSDMRTKRWPIGKERRRHIHHIIDRLVLPVTHHTERVGSPHQLMLKKTDLLFTQAKARFMRCKKVLSGLAKVKTARAKMKLSKGVKGA